MHENLSFKNVVPSIFFIDFSMQKFSKMCLNSLIQHMLVGDVKNAERISKFQICFLPLFVTANFLEMYINTRKTKDT